MLAVFFKNNQKLCILDSYGTRQSDVERKIFDFLKKEWEKSEEAPFNGQIDTELIKNLPKQDNFSDCGVFILLYAETLGKDLTSYLKLNVLNSPPWDVYTAVHEKCVPRSVFGKYTSLWRLYT